MTVAEYAKYKGISKQAVYDKVRRETLLSETVDGIKHIVESVVTPVVSVETPVSSKKLNKALKRLNKVKHKLEIAVNEIQGLNKLIVSKDSELDSLKKSLGLLGVVINNNAALPPPEEIIIKPGKTKKKKDKKSKK